MLVHVHTVGTCQCHPEEEFACCFGFGCITVLLLRPLQLSGKCLQGCAENLGGKAPWWRSERQDSNDLCAA